MFTELNLKKLIQQFDLEATAKQRGEQNLPHTEDTTLDAPQEAVVDGIETLQKQAASEFEQLLQQTRNTLRQLESQIDTSRCESVANETQQAIQHQLADERDAILATRLAEQQSAQDLQRFRQDHQLDRQARYPESQWMHWALVMVAVVLESIANSYFFAKGSDFGLVGGTLQALLLSLVNIGVALLAGLFILPQLNHQTLRRKALALGGILAYAGFLLFFSLATAHYRMQLEINPLTALSQTIPALWQQPFALTHFDALVLFIVGILFALFALYKGYTADDPYPGYGALERHYQRRCQAYRAQKQLLRQHIHEYIAQKQRELDRQVSRLQQTVNRYISGVNDADNHIKHYYNYLETCEKIGNQLLKHYRDYNKTYRRDPPPAYFAQTITWPSPALQATTLDWQTEHELADNFTWVIKDLESKAAEQRTALQQLENQLLENLPAYLADIEQAATQQLAQPLFTTTAITLQAATEPAIPAIAANTHELKQKR